MAIPRNIFGQLAEIILEGGAIKATKYLSSTEVVKATAILYDGKASKRGRSILFTMGKPNYLEREFIKACKAAGEPLPVKKIQIKWPKK